MSSRARSALVALVAAVTIAAPAAQAMPLDAEQTGHPAPSVALGIEYGDLRRDVQPSSLAGTTSPKPAAVQPAPASGGFDWPSAVIGAVVATGLALLSWTAVSMRRSIERRAVSGWPR